MLSVAILGITAVVVALVVLVAWIKDLHDERIDRVQREAAIRIVQRRAEQQLYKLTHSALQAMLDTARRG